MPNRMHSSPSNDTSTKRGVRARRGELHGVFKTLAKQHAEVTALIDRVEADPSQRASLWPKIRIELISHERGELREVYPVLREHAETEQLADQHEAEAQELEALIDQLDNTELESDDWDGLFDQLAGTVLDHAEQEETEIFPLAQRVLSGQMVEDLEDRFLAAKQQIADAA
jgi:hemerythrin superfamily protein